MNSATKQVVTLKEEAMGAWFEELVLPVAPACNIMCNFCSRDCDLCLQRQQP
jgi:MoaA/NifB/PqqE/SkfB family radical SAM enzyme